MAANTDGTHPQRERVEESAYPGRAAARLGPVNPGHRRSSASDCLYGPTRLVTPRRGRHPRASNQVPRVVASPPVASPGAPPARPRRRRPHHRRDAVPGTRRGRQPGGGQSGLLRVDLPSSASSLQLSQGGYLEVGDPTGIEVQSTNNNAPANTRVHAPGGGYDAMPTISEVLSRDADPRQPGHGPEHPGAVRRHPRAGRTC